MCFVDANLEVLTPPPFSLLSRSLRSLQQWVLAQSSPARLAFFLNVYHTLLLHGLLILGAPQGTKKRLSFFSKVADCLSVRRVLGAGGGGGLSFL